MVNKVNEGIAHVGLVVEVDREIEKVVLSLVLFVDFLKKHLLGVFIGNVSDHYRCAHILTSLDPLNIHIEFFIVNTTAYGGLRLSVADADPQWSMFVETFV